MKVTAEIYCASGEFLCETIEDVARSMARDFQLCSECTPDEVVGAFLMEDSARERHLIDMQIRRGSQMSNLRIIPRNNLVAADPIALDSYYTGMQASFKLQRSLMRMPRVE